VAAAFQFAGLGAERLVSLHAGSGTLQAACSAAGAVYRSITMEYSRNPMARQKRSPPELLASTSSDTRIPGGTMVCNTAADIAANSRAAQPGGHIEVANVGFVGIEMHEHIGGEFPPGLKDVCAIFRVGDPPQHAAFEMAGVFADAAPLVFDEFPVYAREQRDVFTAGAPPHEILLVRHPSFPSARLAVRAGGTHCGFFAAADPTRVATVHQLWRGP
jgi:hypothetical protein